MSKPVYAVTRVNDRFGAPMGRTSFGQEHIGENGVMYLAELPLDQGYDAGGAYWGSGEPIFVLFNDELEYFFRARSMNAAIAELTKYDEPYQIVPTESDTYRLWVQEHGFDIVEKEDGYVWKSKHFADTSSAVFDTMEACWEDLIMAYPNIGEEPDDDD